VAGFILHTSTCIYPAECTQAVCTQADTLQRPSVAVSAYTPVMISKAKGTYRLRNNDEST